MIKVLRNKTPIARKEHRCEFCGEVIHIGENITDRPMFVMIVFMIGLVTMIAPN